MHVLDMIGRSLADGGGMFWQTLWALVLGFGISGAVQAFVSRTEMQRALGDHRPATMVRAGFFGAISSSCSYAASALAKTLFARGADFTAAQAFMFASTNLVVELGIVLWLLIGWQFAAAEFIGGALMIALLALVLPRVIPAAAQEAARDSLSGEDDPHAGHGDPQDGHASGSWRTRIRSLAGWSDAAGYTISDLTMLRKELVVGFVVAGFADAVVPVSFWRSLFLTGHGFWSVLENVILGPFLAVISFVCSIGNVPLAAALWSGGITFGGTIAFVFGDLITLPLLLIYRRYYGTRLTVRLLAVFWATMSAAGLVTEYLFTWAGIAPAARRPARFDRAGRLGLELHHLPEHRGPGRVRRAVLAVPQPGAVRRRRRVRQGPGMWDAGSGGACASHRALRRHHLLLLLRPLSAPVQRQPGPLRRRGGRRCTRRWARRR